MYYQYEIYVVCHRIKNDTMNAILMSMQKMADRFLGSVVTGPKKPAPKPSDDFHAFMAKVKTGAERFKH